MGQARGLARERIANVAAVAFCLGLAWGLKRFYSRAGFEDLLWVLAPTTRLVEALTGSRFEPEPGQGYLDRGQLYLIAPSCAGVNFMIACFCSLACGLIHTRPSWAGRAAWVALSGALAYGVTLVANAVRIAIALPMHAAGASLGPIGAERLHGVAGSAVYFCFLLATFVLVARAAGAGRDLAVATPRP